MRETQKDDNVTMAEESVPVLALRGESRGSTDDVGELRVELAAAQAHAAEVERVSQALQRGLERISTASTIDAILDSFLLEAMSLTGAPSGAIVDRVAGTEFVIRSLGQCGAILRPDLHSPEQQLRQVTSLDAAGVMSRVIRGESFGLTVDEIGTWYPQAAAFHRAHGHRVVWHFPFYAGGEVSGFLGLAFAQEISPAEIKTDTVNALAQQASLALQVVRLADQAKLCAVACEREQAAQSLATELVSANKLMRATLDELANTQDPGGFVKATLREVSRQAGSCAAHLFTFDSTSNRLTQWGVVRGGVFYEHAHPDDPPKFREGFDADITPGLRRLLQQGGIGWATAETPAADAWPDTIGWHRKMGHVAYASQVLVAGCRPIGLLGLVFHDRRTLSTNQTERIQVLAQHMALALGLMRLTDHASEAAVLSERQRAAEARARELARTNEALRNATDLLATQTELSSFYGHLLKESAQLLEADAAHLTLIDEEAQLLTTVAHVNHGELCPPKFPVDIPLSKAAPVLASFCRAHGVQYLDTDKDRELLCPGALEFHRSAGHQTVVAVPLLLSERCIGYIGLAFRESLVLGLEQQELLQTLAQHATLAVHLTRLADQVRRGAVLEERVAIAREMHDTLLQGFTGVTLQLRALVKSNPEKPSGIRNALEAIEEEATRSVREARRAVGDMRGNEPGTADLATALQELVKNESHRTNAQVCWRFEGDVRELPAATAESLFRIGREALSNAIRHANATWIDVSLSVNARILRLVVADNGRGFSLKPDADRAQGHWGLIGMEERAERLHGRCRIESSPGQGATVAVEVPL